MRGCPPRRSFGGAEPVGRNSEAYSAAPSLRQLRGGVRLRRASLRARRRTSPLRGGRNAEGISGGGMGAAVKTPPPEGVSLRSSPSTSPQGGGCAPSAPHAPPLHRVSAGRVAGASRPGGGRKIVIPGVRTAPILVRILARQEGRLRRRLEMGAGSGARGFGFASPDSREVPASARPPALRPAVATVHLKPGGFKTSPVQGRGARQRAGDEPAAHRSPGGARVRVTQIRRGGRSAERH